MIDLFEEARARRTRRTAGVPTRVASSPPTACCGPRPTTATTRSAGRTPVSSPSVRARTSLPFDSIRFAPRAVARPSRTSSSPRPHPTSPTWSSTDARWSSTAGTVTVPDVAAELPPPSRDLMDAPRGGHAMTVLYTDIGELVTNDPAQRRRRSTRHHLRRGAGRRRRRDRVGRPTRATRPTPTIGSAAPTPA